MKINNYLLIIIIDTYITLILILILIAIDTLILIFLIPIILIAPNVASWVASHKQFHSSQSTFVHQPKYRNIV